MSSFQRNIPLSVPVARKEPHTIYFGKIDENEENFRGKNLMHPPRSINDWYYWLRDDARKNVEVINHLQAENKYCEERTAHLVPLQDELYKEILSHLKETDEDYPYKHGPYLYFSRTVQGMSYTIHCRKSVDSDLAVEQIILDENQLAAGHDYCDVQSIVPSPSHRLLAYSVDHKGDETFLLRIATMDGESSSSPQGADEVETSGDIEWGNDDSTLFYLKVSAPPSSANSSYLLIPLCLSRSDGRATQTVSTLPALDRIATQLRRVVA